MIVKRGNDKFVVVWEDYDTRGILSLNNMKMAWNKSKSKLLNLSRQHKNTWKWEQCRREKKRKEKKFCEPRQRQHPEELISCRKREKRKKRWLMAIDGGRGRGKWWGEERGEGSGAAANGWRGEWRTGFLWFSWPFGRFIEITLVSKSLPGMIRGTRTLNAWMY